MVGGGCGWWVVGGRLCFLSLTLSAFILTHHHLSCYFFLCVFLLLLFLLLPLLMWSLYFLSPFLVLSSLSSTLHPSPLTYSLSFEYCSGEEEDGGLNQLISYTVRKNHENHHALQVSLTTDVLTECSVAIRIS